MTALEHTPAPISARSILIIKHGALGDFVISLAAMQAMTGKNLSEVEISTIAAGPSEEDLVNSGLEETMVTSYQKIRDMRRHHGDKPDLRTAAFIVAIDMIAVTYGDLGIFP